MSDGTVRTSLPLVLLGQGRRGRGENDWLVNVLSANRYAVLEAESGVPFRARAAATRPDIIVLTEEEEGTGLELVRAVRADGLIDASTPILLILRRAASRADRLAALAAGVWDLITPPYDAELLVQQIGVYAAARLVASRAIAEGLTDHATMLYNRTGLARRVRELGALAYRDHAAIGCLALVVDELPAPPAGVATDPGVITRSVQALRATTRQSDVLGRVGAMEFVIVAPGADAAGCRRLARRVAERLLEGASPVSRRIRGGYDAVFNAGYAPFAPVDLLVRASTAVRTGHPERELEWLRRYGSSAPSPTASYPGME
ncbi:MAG TPA: diguanylate cyclase [Gemmatimonadales bacterium]|nr:diguanylate cyclase [Gemmatimonadales bacterium]